MATTTETESGRFRLFPELDHAGEGPFLVKYQALAFAPPHRLFEPRPAQFDELEVASTACKRAADQLLLASLQAGMSGADLWRAYQAFGAGFCVIDRVGLLQFSADVYAHRRCTELAPGPYAAPPKEQLTIAQQSVRDKEGAAVAKTEAAAAANKKRAMDARRSLSLALWFIGAIPLVWATMKVGELDTTLGQTLHAGLLFIGFWYFIALFWLQDLVDRLFAPR